MGLGRYFTINAEHKNGTPIYNPALADKILDKLNSMYGDWSGTLEDNGSLTIDDVNWYDVDEHMTRLAEEFPDIVFTVHCEGMSLDDVWDVGYCGDRTAYSGASIPDLDMEYLRTGKQSIRRPITLEESEYDLIMDALNCLAEARESEIKWANGDPDIVEPDQDCLNEIEKLQERLRCVI